ncbi:DUF4670 domain-containing protein [Candidatus Mycoplasma haematohominis]|uniref:Uncharacterized protein n=1 Tax=Candidatus Mycoplasma haematohominis TaxID=1494318 RepID=A0A478FRQ0_9MOLU|nr:DUF4670 domain-containing protein [Candidatus Mycoplasma haemohominis]GCE63109.1 hypothetical protein MHSWG343_00870 [Candidatus Mycoplasma haemohominis]
MIDGLGCYFGLEGRNQKICDEVYVWLWGYDGGKGHLGDPGDLGKRKNGFYDLRNRIYGTPAEQRRREAARKKQQEEEQRRQLEREKEKAREKDPTHPSIPEPKEQPKKKKTKPGTFGYYGWYVDWGI